MSSTDGMGKRSGGGPRACVAFLRGLNMGGRRVIAMADLRAAFASLGIENARTILASGNVVFEFPAGNAAPLPRDIQRGLKSSAGLDAEVILRPLSRVMELAVEDPFAAIKRTPETRLCVTFLRDASAKARTFAAESAGGDVRSWGLSAGEVASVIILSAKCGTPDLMRNIEKEFGRAITTRSWSTIVKIAGSERARASDREGGAERPEEERRCITSCSTKRLKIISSGGRPSAKIISVS